LELHLKHLFFLAGSFGILVQFAVVSGLLDKMVKLTMVARVTDGLPLAEGLDDGRDQKDADFYKQQAKLLFKNLSKGQHEASRMSIETGPYYFQYPYVLCGYFILGIVHDC
jgi:hypothetical protein